MFPFDVSLAHYIADSRTDLGISFFGAITHLGDVWFSLFAASLICLFLYASKTQRYVPELAIISIGSAFTVWYMKILFALPRPANPVAFSTFDSFSFPSGHAAAAATLYGFLIWILLGTGKTDRARTLLAGLFFMIIVLVGYSRLYIGAHYYTDVIAGYIVGFVWVAIGVAVAHYFKKRM